ncbi:uncharacterized protein LOC133814077 [Humulus lupulus]|uniref:uncharacterized protein LOC133814077 n=1 Tax=Humulus lupulus TaxID=3486 RepID=UPI002B41141A|nr:uncharacterized protein LOC133814077 [Humulus lupulus]
MNVKAKFKTDHYHNEMYAVAYAWKKTQFVKHFENIKRMDPAIVEYLEGIGFDKWSRLFFPGKRYNIMTSNYTESFKNKTRDARTFLVTTFLEFIRFTQQSLVFEQRYGDDEVNLMTKSCSCGIFQLIGIPCVHAVAATLEHRVNIYYLCSSFYTIESWRDLYKETIYPTGNEDDWIVPYDIKIMEVVVPVEKQPVGHPKKKI